MAKKKKKSGFLKRIMKFFLFLLILGVLIAGGFAAGVYFQLIDGNEINKELQLYKLPVIGEYIPRPPGVPEDEEELSEEEPSSEAEKAKEDEKPKQEEEKPKQSKPVTISKEEIDKQMKEREAAERKRVSKLARLYNEMKPQEAADAMADLDDDLTVAILQRMDEGNAAKTLAKMDAEKTARLTQIMYEGVQRKLTVSSETQQQQPEE